MNQRIGPYDGEVALNEARRKSETILRCHRFHSNGVALRSLSWEWGDTPSDMWWRTRPSVDRKSPTRGTYRDYGS